MTTNENSHASVKIYWLVFLGLLILTGLTVTLSYWGLPHMTAISLAALIAFIKCSLIGMFFMHLRWENVKIPLLFLSAFVFLAFLIGTIISDVGMRP